jgi:hypothetical protein
MGGWQNEYMHAYVYRVENSQGCGPYSGKSPLDTTASARQPVDWTLWNIAGGKGSGRPYRFAFRNIRQVRLWFSEPEVKTLAQAEFVVVKYRVPRYALYVGNKQVLFDLEEAKVVRTLTWEEACS